jgi:ketosteroid isomerase-like protein
MTESGARDLVERFIDAYNRFDVAAMCADLHADIEFRNVSDGQIDASTSGLDAFRRLAETSAALFSARLQNLTEWAFEADRARVGIAFEATFAVDLPNGIRRGDTLRLTGESIYAFRDGKISAITDISGHG